MKGDNHIVNSNNKPAQAEAGGVNEDEKIPESSDDLVEVALPVPLYETFTYYIPENLKDLLEIGCRVVVPFGKSAKIGVVTGFPETTDLENIRHIIDKADTDPPLNPNVLELCRWITEYYACPIGETLSAAHPAGMLAESKKIVRLITSEGDDFLRLEGFDIDIAEIIERLKIKKSILLKTLRKQYPGKAIFPRLMNLQRRGIIEIVNDIPVSSLKPKTEKIVSLNSEISNDDLDTLIAERELRAPKQAVAIRYLRNFSSITKKILMTETGVSSNTLKTLAAKNIIVESEHELIRESGRDLDEEIVKIVHTNYQSEAIKSIKSKLGKDKFAPFLLHGVTGSGKTEVYLEIISHCLALGKSALVLVPEIALTPQISSRFRRRFGGQVVVLHSRISAGERYDSWRRLAKGEARVAIGARSALFAPLVNPGLIIVDEEHEPTFKQTNRPHYNARDCAVIMAKTLKIPIVLGSATPSIETFENARRGKYKLLELPDRVASGRFSAFHLVDISQKGALIGNTSISPLLMEKIEDRLDHGDKTIILQNRRGFSTFLKCKHCGTVEECPNCSLTLTYHITNRRLRCHICGYQKRAPTYCGECGGAELMYCGSGTQKVEEELSGFFPDARIVRMDLDTTAGVDSHFNILDGFQKGKYDILLGTQMVAKGLDFPDVTLVGIISADTELLQPDFRSEERTFRLLVQAAGRSGRHRPGEVVVQTYNPQHKVFDFVKMNDYEGFFKKTIQYRKALHYPPFGRIILVRISSAVEKSAAEASTLLSQRIKKEGFLILGPSPALLAKVKRRFYYNILIKTGLLPFNKLADIKKDLLNVKSELLKEIGSKDIGIEIDVDPITLH